VKDFATRAQAWEVPGRIEQSTEWPIILLEGQGSVLRRSAIRAGPGADVHGCVFRGAPDCNRPEPVHSHFRGFHDPSDFDKPADVSRPREKVMYRGAQARLNYRARRIMAEQTIFIVEDDSDICRLVQHHLKTAGFATTAFSKRSYCYPKERNRHGHPFFFSMLWFLVRTDLSCAAGFARCRRWLPLRLFF
jgi:hypothetical protein